VEKAWRPFAAPLRAFLAGGDAGAIELAGGAVAGAGLCWNETFPR
jgi:hypothetical protein